MKILLINSEFPPVGGGAGNATANIARRLAALGEDVTVLTSRYGDLSSDQMQDGYRIYRVPASRRRADRSGALEQTVFIAGGFLGALRLIRKWRPQVILAFFGVPGGVIATSLHLLYGTPYVVSLRGGDVPGFRPYDFAFYHRIIGPLLHYVWRRASAVVANSSGLRDLAQAFDLRIPIRIIPNGVDLERYTPAPRQWEPTRLLFVGRIVYQKGLDLLLPALSKIKGTPWELALAGDGPERDNLQDMAENLQINGRLKFLGWLSRANVQRQYQQANLFVFPSRHEGMPNAILEAMASGLPVVATRIAGNEELVVHGETGLLVPPEDSQHLQKALEELLPDVDLRQRLGAAGRERTEALYSWSHTGDRYLELLQQIVEEK